MAKNDSKGILVSNEILRSEELSLIEKLLFIEICRLHGDQGAFASNRYYAEFLGVSLSRISPNIASLKHKGFITLTIRNNNQRIIHLTKKIPRLDSRKFGGGEGGPTA